MALTKCSDCGKEISSSASKCPYCGKARTTGTGITIAVLLAIGIGLGIIYFLYTNAVR